MHNQGGSQSRRVRGSLGGATIPDRGGMGMRRAGEGGGDAYASTSEDTKGFFVDCIAPSDYFI